MITNISLTDVWVKDIDAAKAFYVDKLGFVERADITMDGYRWCTVGHPDQAELELHLALPGPPQSPEFVAAIEQAMDEGGTFAVGLRADDCRATVADLEAKGVEVVNQPEDRPYGVEAVVRDNSGNWLVIVEPSDWNG